MRRLNGKLLAMLVVAVALSGAAIYALHGFQVKRNLGGLLQQADRAERKADEAERKADPAEARKQRERAAEYLSRYLIYKPDDTKALLRFARTLDVLAKTDQERYRAFLTFAQALRNEPGRQDVRRRVAIMAMELRLVDEARRYIEALLDPKVSPTPPDDPGRWEALLGQCHEFDKQYEKARDRYKQALAHPPAEVVWYPLDGREPLRTRKPGVVALTERLAGLYEGPLRDEDPKRAEAMLNDLVRAWPKEAEAWMARSRFLARAGQTARARADLDEAIRLKPDDPDVRLTAAGAAQQAGDLKAARLHLQAAGAPARDDRRYWLIQGLIATREDRAEDAIASWREGMARAGGADAELSWRLAYALLQQNRLDEAEPMLEQYRRLGGGAEPPPVYLYLEALKYIKSNRPVEAISTLESIEAKIADRAMNAQLQNMLGQAYEATRDEAQALDHYRQAAALIPDWPLPWLGIAQVAEGRGLEEEANELTRGLEQIPNSPELLIALARVRWRQQAGLPEEKRSWGALERALARAEAVAPAAPALIVLRADYLMARGRPDEAVALLDRAARKLNRKSAELWTAYANALVRQGKLDEAGRALEQAGADDAAGDQVLLRIARADLLKARQHGQAARDALIKDWRTLPPAQRPTAWKALGDLNLDLKDTPAARAAYAQWAALLPDDPRPRQVLFELALAADDAAGVREQVDALRRIGGEQGLYVRMARALELLHEDPAGSEPGASVPVGPANSSSSRFAEADKEVAAVLAIAPKLPNGYLLRGLVRERQGRLDEAIAAYEEAIQHGGGAGALGRKIALMAKQGRFEELAALAKQSNSPAGFDRLVAVEALRAGRKDKAAELVGQVLRRDPGADLWASQVLNALGKPDEAEHALRDLTARRPGETAPWLALLLFQVNRGPDHAPDVAATLERIKAEVKTDQPELFLALCYGIARDTKRAAEAYQAALEKHPDDPTVRQAAAEFDRASGRSAEAEASLRHVLKGDPKASWAARELALLLAARPGDSRAWAEAWSLVGPGSALDDSAESRLARATVLARSPEPGRHREAVGLLERLVADLPVGDPRALEAHDLLAVLHLRAGEPAKAGEHAAMVAAPDKPAAIAAYAQILLGQGKPDEAARQLERLAALAPDALLTVALRARVLQARGKGPEAVALLEKAFRARRETPEGAAVGRALVPLLAELGHLDAAEAMGRDLARLKPETACVLARVLARRGRLQEALDQCRAAVAASPREAGATAVQLVAATGSGSTAAPPERLEQAVAIVAEAMKAQPKAGEVVVMMALLRRAQGRHADEVQLDRDALALNPADDATRNNLAWALSEDLGRHAEGLKLIDEAIGRAGRYAQFLDTRGVILAHLPGRLDEAIKDLQEAAEAIRTGSIYFHLARACRQANRLDEARRALAKAREAGLTPAQLDPRDRAELEAMMKEPATAAAR